jgi:hypothetical protein
MPGRIIEISMPASYQEFLSKCVFPEKSDLNVTVNIFGTVVNLPEAIAFIR